MSTLQELQGLFKNGEIIVDGECLRFIGKLGSVDCAKEFVQHFSAPFPEGVEDFISVFGGTQLYVDEYGLGVKVISSEEIVSHNLKAQLTTETFWPHYMIFGYTSSDDMLILSFQSGEAKFGVLDHEAWAEPNEWEAEAIEWFEFEDWLSSLVKSNGEVA